MYKINNFFNIKPYSLSPQKKNSMFIKKINELNSFHKKNSSKYKKIVENIFLKKKLSKLEEFPFLPVKIFKEIELKSITDNKIIKVLTSSGTSGQKKSKIYLDKFNSENQVKVLKNIVSHVIGSNRLPMLIVDYDHKKKKNNELSARFAAILGFSIFGKNHTYMLDEKFKINYKNLNYFLDKYGDKPFFIFGFTNLVYENLIEKLSKDKLIRNFKNGILIHGGGWKKIEDKKISTNLYKKLLNEKISLTNVYNYYGMIEQTGSIFLECPNCDSLITSIYSDIIIRDKNLNVLNKEKVGLVQLISTIPTSYPGHNIITEDLGKIVNKSKNCKLNVKHFKILGRSKKSEVRGCSDV